MQFVDLGLLPHTEALPALSGTLTAIGRRLLLLELHPPLEYLL